MAIAIEKRAEEERLAAGEGKDEAISKTPPTVDDEAEYIQPSVKEYVVKFNPKKRDCLWRISLYVYRDARLWPLIYVANRDKIKDPDLIFPGQKFVIPPVPRKRAEKEPVSTLTDEKKEEDRISPEGPPEDGKNDGPAE